VRPEIGACDIRFPEHPGALRGTVQIYLERHTSQAQQQLQERMENKTMMS